MIAKKDYIEALTAGGVPLTGDEKLVDLQKLAEEHSITVESKPEAPDATSASVMSATGGHVRTYTKEVHGDAFADLAKEFSDHTPGSSVQLA